MMFSLVVYTGAAEMVLNIKRMVYSSCSVDFIRYSSGFEKMFLALLGFKMAGCERAIAVRQMGVAR